MADIAHRMFGVALGQGQKPFEWCWLVLRHRPDPCRTAAQTQSHPAISEALRLGLERSRRPTAKGPRHRATALEEVEKLIPRLQVQQLEKPPAEGVGLHATQAPSHGHIRAVPIANR